ncbi:cyclase family protein [Mariniphaga sp.]|uniref:cyclase family protein n=1 Tax=Mariniphaga sp. TaxID=1954475 RepID=UPI003565E4D1
MKFIDVTLTYQPGMRGVDFEPAKIFSKDGWNAKTLHLYSHSGTHMDAPVHFEVNDKSIDQVDPARFFVSCYVVDLTGIQPNTEITVSDLGEVGNQIQKEEGLIFRTGWSRFVNEPVYRDGLPGISRELAEWCIKKGIAFIGVEPPSIADVNNLEKLMEIHRILLGGDVLIVEGLTNLEKITKQKVQLVALPLKIKDGDGAPCRVIVIEES